MAHQFKITIITVCKNAENTIDRTIQSVIKQSYTNIEYIIVDGKSIDKTLEIVRAYQERYPIKLLSEPDKGIYDAMNKGIRMSTGDFLLFENAGDCLVSQYTIRNIVRHIKNKNMIYYGNAILSKNGKKRTYICEGMGDIWSVLANYMPNHQCMLAPRVAFCNNNFDLKYSIGADYNWVIKTHKKKLTYQYLNMFISCYDMSGISANPANNRKLQQERARSREEQYPFIHKHWSCYQKMYYLLERCRKRKW